MVSGRASCCFSSSFFLFQLAFPFAFAYNVLVGVVLLSFCRGGGRVCSSLSLLSGPWWWRAFRALVLRSFAGSAFGGCCFRLGVPLWCFWLLAAAFCARSWRVCGRGLFPSLLVRVPVCAVRVAAAAGPLPWCGGSCRWAFWPVRGVGACLRVLCSGCCARWRFAVAGWFAARCSACVPCFCGLAACSAACAPCSWFSSPCFRCLLRAWLGFPGSACGACCGFRPCCGGSGCCLLRLPACCAARAAAGCCCWCRSCGGSGACWLRRWLVCGCPVSLPVCAGFCGLCVRFWGLCVRSSLCCLGSCGGGGWCRLAVVPCGGVSSRFGAVFCLWPVLLRLWFRFLGLVVLRRWPWRSSLRLAAARLFCAVLAGSAWRRLVPRCAACSAASVAAPRSVVFLGCLRAALLLRSTEARRKRREQLQCFSPAPASPRRSPRFSPCWGGRSARLFAVAGGRSFSGPPFSSIFPLRGSQEESGGCAAAAQNKNTLSRILFFPFRSQ